MTIAETPAEVNEFLQLFDGNLNRPSLSELVRGYLFLIGFSIVSPILLFIAVIRDQSILGVAVLGFVAIGGIYGGFLSYRHLASNVSFGSEGIVVSSPLGVGSWQLHTYENSSLTLRYVSDQQFLTVHTFSGSQRGILIRGSLKKLFVRYL